MAARLRFKLPPLKVTQWSSAGGTAVNRSVPRVSSTTQRIAVTEKGTGDKLTAELDTADIGDFPEEMFDTGVSLYSIKKKSAAVEWEALRPQLLKCTVSSYAMPDNQLCLLCPSPATTRCLKCGARAYFCSQCFSDLHMKINILHVGEVWENGAFKPAINLLEHRVVDFLPFHECISKRIISLCCVDEDGAEHAIEFMCCSCEPLAVTMARARLWPATPYNPRICFTFDLLDWAEALMLECQVSLKDFCASLCFKCPYLFEKRKNLYLPLRDAFEAYRFLKQQLRIPSFLCHELDSGNVCPACPKETGLAIISMDALFGLPRKKSAGQSFHDPLNGQLFFLDQSNVDEYVETKSSANMKKLKVKKDCSDFLAGDSLRSATRFHALDETAVYGCGCRHEFPLMFLSLKHGERLVYADYMLHQLLSHFKDGIKIALMYDIACTFHKHMELHGMENLFQRVELAVPAFHAYGHRAECQMLFSPLRTQGVGLSDGEMMERLWSFLRRFARMTKEMRPAHRIDVLTSALLYYAMCTKNKLSTLLTRRWRRTHETKTHAMEELTRLMSTCNVNESTIERWITEERVFAEAKFEAPPSEPPSNQKEYEYFFTLQTYYDKRAGVSQRTETSTAEDITWLIDRLEILERECEIVNRWKPNDQKYMYYLNQQTERKRNLLRQQMWSAVVKRQFLLKQMAKYADGQKIAKRLSKQIGRETSIIKKCLGDYNSLSDDLPLLGLHDVLSSHAKFWADKSLNAEDDLALSNRHELIRNFLLVKRAEEEVVLLSSDMENTITYFKEQQRVIEEEIGNLEKSLVEVADDEKLYVCGCICVLKKFSWSVSISLNKATAAAASLSTSCYDQMPDESDVDEDEDDCSDFDEEF